MFSFRQQKAWKFFMNIHEILTRLSTVIWFKGAIQRWARHVNKRGNETTHNQSNAYFIYCCCLAGIPHCSLHCLPRQSENCVCVYVCMAGLRQHWRVTGKLCPADRWHVGRGKRHCVSKHSQAKSSTPTPFHQTPHVSLDSGSFFFVSVCICVSFVCYVPAQMCVHIRDVHLCMSLVCFFFVFAWSCLTLGIRVLFF